LTGIAGRHKSCIGAQIIKIQGMFNSLWSMYDSVRLGGCAPMCFGAYGSQNPGCWNLVWMRPIYYPLWHSSGKLIQKIGYQPLGCFLISLFFLHSWQISAHGSKCHSSTRKMPCGFSDLGSKKQWRLELWPWHIMYMRPKLQVLKAFPLM